MTPTRRIPPLALAAALVPIAVAVAGVPAVLPLRYSGDATHPTADWPESTEDCEIVYSDTSNPTGYVYNDQLGSIIMDDLHMTQGGRLCSFDVGYSNSSGGPVDITVEFYANGEANITPATLVAGPFVLESLPTGVHIAHFAARPEGPTLPAHVWLAVSWASSGVQLLIYGPPTTGTSQDVFYKIPPGGLFWFGGNPAADFCLQVECEPDTPVEPTTWGAVKAMFR